MALKTVRALSDDRVLCFGPDDGMYEPKFDPRVARVSIESDESRVLADWQLAHTPAVDRQAQALADARVPQWFKDYLG